MAGKKRPARSAAGQQWTPKQVVDLAMAHDLAELEVESGGLRVRVVWDQAERAATLRSPAALRSVRCVVAAGGDGTFRDVSAGSGLDVAGAYGEVVRAVRSEKVVSPVANWGFGDLNEGLRVGVFSYIHMRVGRDKDEKVFHDPRLVPVQGNDGKVVRMRVRRGTRFQPGDALGAINRMYHVHLNVGPPGAEINPLTLSPIGFADKVDPVIAKDGIQLFDEAGARLVEKQSGRLIVHGRVNIIVDAFDRNDMNASRRRLGLYSLGYQVLKVNGTPAQGFEQPRINLVFNRLPANWACCTRTTS